MTPLMVLIPIGIFTIGILAGSVIAARIANDSKNET